MKKRIGVMLCVILLSGLVSGCGAEESNLTEDSNITAFGENGEPEATDVAVSGNDQCLMTEEGTGEITMPEEEPEFWGADYILEIEFGYGDYATQEDIVHIGQCSNLRRLDIAIKESEIDLSPLGNLTELESLTITILCSPDLSFMRNLTRLEELELSVHVLDEEVDLSPIGSLTELRKLTMGDGDYKSDLSFLENLNQLIEIAIIKWCEVKDLSYFQDMLCLQDLYITYVDDVDLNYLSELTNLESLTITGQNIRNIEGISDLINLKELSLSDTSSDAWYGKAEPLDLRSLENLTQLKWIDLECIHLDDITPLADLKDLHGIILANTRVEDIFPLTKLENLNLLSIYRNESELVEEQAETYFSEVEDVLVTEEMIYGW